MRLSLALALALLVAVAGATTAAASPATREVDLAPAPRDYSDKETCQMRVGKNFTKCKTGCTGNFATAEGHCDAPEEHIRGECNLCDKASQCKPRSSCYFASS